MTGRHPAAQVGDLARLRLSTLTPGARAALFAAGLLAVVVGPGAFALALWAAPQLTAAHRVQAGELLPGTFVLVGVGIVVAAVASGGGRELIPRQQLVAYPVTPVAEHLMMLALTPANLAWWVQAVGLFLVAGTATYADLAPGGPVLLPAAMVFLVCAVWIAAATTFAQWLAWLLDGVRLLPAGAWVIRAAMLVLAIVVVRSMNAEALTALLDWAPPRAVTERALAAADGDWLAGTSMIALFGSLSVGFVMIGAWTYTLVSRRPARVQASRETQAYRPARLPVTVGFLSDVRVWHRQDWALMSRSIPIRRGLVVLTIVPAIGGALSRMGVHDLSLLTAVVAAASALVVGVNAFALDADGAPWRESLPAEPRIWFVSRALVLTEVTIGTALIATLAASTGARGRLDLAAAVAVIVAVPVMTGQVVARCLRWSVHRPQRAELRTTRDSPTGPGQLVVYSAKLMAATMFLGILLGTAARTGLWWAPIVIALPSALLTVRRLQLTLKDFENHEIRARLVQVVSRG